jgi:hypothetical protein
MTANNPGPGPVGPQYRARLAAGHETGFWDEHGHPAPWPDDIDEWRPTTGEPITLEHGQEPF